MGEAVMSCEGDEGLKDVEIVMEVDVSDGRLVRREKFPPRTALRVLLVEADDSTRQVIGALLRKCGYKVSGVSDGLKAWEVLKGMPNSIDLILAEVDLPSISGFALLTLIMEHDSCKNTPVIMMSSNDSVNMVYKCMLRGAADFLVKPVRKNELQNLWQHVWRRQTLKAEGLSDNDLLINLSNGACTPENEECNEKGNGAQSSCSVQDNEAESGNSETLQRSSKLIVDNVGLCDAGSNEEERIRDDSTTLKPNSVVKGSSTESPEDAVRMIQREDPGGKNYVKDRNTTAEASGNNDALINGSREAIDLMGNFKDHSTKSCINSSVITGSTRFDPCPQLDLSLRRRYDDSESHVDAVMDVKSHAVHQSNASAFSRYIAVQPLQNTQANTLKEYVACPDKQVCSPAQPSSLDASPSHQNTELGQGDIAFCCDKGRMLPVTIPIKSVRLDRTCPSNGSSLHPSYYNQTGDSPTTNPDSAGTRELLSQVTQVQEPYTHRGNQENNKAMEHLRNASSTNDRSQNANLHIGSINRLNSIGGSGSACGSNGSGNGNPFTHSKADGISTQEENINRTLQREAALTKFRQKRKDRCFEKKVRYESRKKLAEQRPRVKGQFVRQLPADVSTTTIEDIQ